MSPESFCLLFQPPLSGPVSFIHSFIAKLLRAPELCAPVSPESARRLTLGSYMANFNKLPLEAFTEKGATHSKALAHYKEHFRKCPEAAYIPRSELTVL